jgi:hypothetical protein
MTVTANNELSTKSLREIAEDIRAMYENMGNGYQNFLAYIAEIDNNHNHQ